MAWMDRRYLMFALMSLVGSLSIAQDEKVEPHASSSGSSWESNSDGWTLSSNYKVTGYAKRPDARVLKSVTAHWESPEIDPLGNFCTVHGQLRIPGGDGKPTRPIDWFQGITVYVARQPDTEPNWSNGTNEKDTLERTQVVDGAGNFEVTIDLRKLKRDRKLEQPFQFGLALAKHTTRNGRQEQVDWSSQTPVDGASIQVLKVPAAPPLSREMELINHAGGWPFSNPDGVALIRAVNALRKLGKDEAILVLEEYVKVTDEYYGYRQEQETVFWIIRLLFEPIRLDERIPAPGIAVYLLDRDSADAPLWPLNPMDLVEDVPLMVGIQISMGGMPEHPSSHIEWVRRHCVIRDEPLRPTKHPLAAAEELLRSRKFAQLDERGLVGREAITSLRAQALAMVAGILEPLPRRPYDEATQQLHWDARLREAEKLQLTWDDEAERFVASKPAKPTP